MNGCVAETGGPDEAGSALRDPKAAPSPAPAPGTPLPAPDCAPWTTFDMLELPARADWFVASGLSASGEVVGAAGVSEYDPRPILIDASVHHLADARGYATAINDAHHATVILDDGIAPPVSHRWSSSTGLTEIPALGGRFTYARAINAADWVVGEATDEAGTARPFLAVPGSPALDLLGRTTFTQGYALDVNDGGEVVGEASGPSGGGPFVWSTRTGVVLLPAEGGGLARAINLEGAVVGWSRRDGAGADRSAATLWTAGDHTRVELAHLEEAELHSDALDVDDCGRAAGLSLTSTHDRVAVLWQDGEVIDLTTRIPDLPPRTQIDMAIAIEAGAGIVAEAWLADGRHTWVRLVPRS